MIVKGSDTIGAAHYLVQKYISSGSSGSVYNALLLDRHIITNTTVVVPTEGSFLEVAIKVVLGVSRTIEHELMVGLSGVNGICSVIEHNNITTPAYIPGQKSNLKVNKGLYSYYLVMPYIKSVKEAVLRKDPVLLHLYIQRLLLALACLNELGVVHHDLKPHNFLMDKEGHSALIDFDLALFSDHWVSRCRSCGFSQVIHDLECPMRHWTAAVVVDTIASPKLFVPTDPFSVDQARLDALGYDIHQPHSKQDAVVTSYTVPLTEHPCRGTVGYRSPEALMCWRHVSTPYDVWSAGIMILKIALETKHSPFYALRNDIGLHDLEAIVGPIALRRTAQCLGTSVKNWCPIQPSTPELSDPEAILQHRVGLISTYITKRGPADSHHFSPDLLLLLAAMLELNPFNRITASTEALRSRYISEYCS